MPIRVVVPLLRTLVTTTIAILVLSGKPSSVTFKVLELSYEKIKHTHTHMHTRAHTHTRMKHQPLLLSAHTLSAVKRPVFRALSLQSR